jgi:hypothetical protein
MAKASSLWKIVIGLLNLLIFWGILQVWWSKTDEPPTSPAQKIENGLTDLPSRDPQPESFYETVVTKNLFSPQRHSEINIINGQLQKNDFDNNILQGIIVVGQGRAALVTPKDPQPDNPVEIIRPGEIWHGYKVLEIDADKVVFESKEGQKIMSFPEPKAKEGIIRLQ